MLFRPFAALALLASLAAAQDIAIDPGAVAGADWRIFNRKVTAVTEAGRKILRFDEAPDAGIAWNSKIAFLDGDIEFDTRGRDVFQQSFVGVVFHVIDDLTWETVWLRPFNYQATDSARHAHALQYASYPAFSWQVLREKHPGAYESAVPPDLKADEWVHVRVEIRGVDVRVFLNGAKTPTLVVKAPQEPKRGGFGLWVGDKSNGDFANVRVRVIR